jgi:acyl-CoA hydrolase
MSEPVAHLTNYTDIVFPGETNHHDTLFGGTALSHMDMVAFVAATRHGRRSFVTASCERIDFNKPANRGSIIDFSSKVVRVGTRSLTVEVDMFAEDLLEDKKVHCTQGLFHMVSTDQDKPKMPPPTMDAATENTDGFLCRYVEMIFADHTNHYGTLFGGNALAMMGKAAFITATRHSRLVFVMAGCNKTDFIASASEGEIIEVAGRVKTIGTTSLTIEVAMYAEDLYSGDRRLCAQSDFTMVAVDEAGKPKALNLS